MLYLKQTVTHQWYLQLKVKENILRIFFSFFLPQNGINRNSVNSLCRPGFVNHLPFPFFFILFLHNLFLFHSFSCFFHKQSLNPVFNAPSIQRYDANYDCSLFVPIAKYDWLKIFIVFTNCICLHWLKSIYQVQYDGFWNAIEGTEVVSFFIRIEACFELRFKIQDSFWSWLGQLVMFQCFLLKLLHMSNHQSISENILSCNIWRKIASNVHCDDGVIIENMSKFLIVNLDLRKAHLASILPWLRGVSILASVTCVKIVERVDVDCENIDYISVICVRKKMPRKEM